MTGEVAAVWIYDRASAAMRGVASARALADHGFEGCGHARPGKKRQVLLIDEETLAQFGLAPGMVKENLTTRGIAIQSLAPGERVRAGSAVLEITGPCEPCAFMDTLRPGLRAATEGKRGVLARVVDGGVVARGDRIERPARG